MLRKKTKFIAPVALRRSEQVSKEGIPSVTFYGSFSKSTLSSVQNLPLSVICLTPPLKPCDKNKVNVFFSVKIHLDSFVLDLTGTNF